MLKSFVSKLIFSSFVLLTTILLAGCGTVNQVTESKIGGAFTDDFNSYTTSLFNKSDGYSNGGIFNCGWLASHAFFDDGKLVLKLDNTSSSGKLFSSGEYRTNNFYGYGTLEASIKAAKGDGIVGGSLFWYTGPSDGKPWDEIDLEFLGKDTTKMQTNYYTNSTGSHETIIDLGFDASAAFHTYKIEWQKDKIVWYVDGLAVHTEDGSKGALPSTPGRIMMNLWPGTGVDSWLKPFTYTVPIYAYYDWIKYTPGP